MYFRHEQAVLHGLAFLLMVMVSGAIGYAAGIDQATSSSTNQAIITR